MGFVQDIGLDDFRHDHEGFDPRDDLLKVSFDNGSYLFLAMRRPEQRAILDGRLKLRYSDELALDLRLASEDFQGWCRSLSKLMAPAVDLSPYPSGARFRIGSVVRFSGSYYDRGAPQDRRAHDFHVEGRVQWIEPTLRRPGMHRGTFVQRREPPP